MFNRTSLFLLFLSFFCSCEQNGIGLTYQIEEELSTALSLGSFFKIKDDVFFCYDNGIGYILHRKNRELDLFLKKEDCSNNSTKEDLDDFKEKEQKDSSLILSSGQLNILKFFINPSDHCNYTFYQKDDIEKEYFSISSKSLVTKATNYNGEIDNLLGFEARKSNLFHALLHGSYFKNGYKIKILLTDRQLFLIVNEKSEIYERTFVHFLRKNNTFLNRSFSNSSFDYQNNFSSINSNMKIKMFKIENIEEFDKIRMGQYYKKKKYWVQIFEIDEVLKNPLLKQTHYEISKETPWLFFKDIKN